MAYDYEETARIYCEMAKRPKRRTKRLVALEMATQAIDVERESGLPEHEHTARPSRRRGGRMTKVQRAEVFQDEAGERRWRVIGFNGEIVATSGEGYVTKAWATTMAADLFGASGIAVVVDPQ